MVSQVVVANLVVGAMVVLSLALALLAIRAWAYARDSRSLLLAIAFAVFLVKSLVLLVGLFVLSNWFALLVASVAFDLAILVGFYLAALR